MDCQTGSYNTADNNSNGNKVFLWIIIGVLIIIIIMLIILILVNNRSDNKTTNRGSTSCGGDGKLNEPCTSMCPCGDGLSCQNGTCKAQLGQTCSAVSDCDRAANACRDNICVQEFIQGNGARSFVAPTKFSSNSTVTSDPNYSSVFHSTATFSNISSTSRTVGLNQSCSASDTRCADGLICDDASGSVCKVQEGDICSASTECEQGTRCALSRRRGRRAHKRERKLVCQAIDDVGQGCMADSNCSSGRCSDSRLLIWEDTDDDGNNYNDREVNILHSFPSQTLIDVTSLNSDLLLLFADGNLMIKKDNRLEMIMSDIQMERIVVLGVNQDEGPTIYGVRDGQLYVLDEEETSFNDWMWLIAEWAPNGIVDISVTEQGQYLWIQYQLDYVDELPHGNNYQIRQRYPESSMTQIGALYQYVDGDDPNLLREMVVSSYSRRVYGPDEVSYLEIDIRNNQAIRTPRNDIIDDFLSGVMLSDRTVVKVSTREDNRIKTVRLVDDEIYLITIRRCIRNGDNIDFSAIMLESVE